MNQITEGQVRHLITVIGGAVVANGWADQQTVEMVTGIILIVAGFVWSYFNKKKVQAEMVKIKAQLASVQEAK